MSFLTQGFPCEIEGYEINTDFRLWLDFERDMANMQSGRDLIVMLEKYYACVPPVHPVQAVSILVRFYAPNTEGNRKEQGAGIAPRAYDYEIDAPLIYAAFLAQYGIDLLTVSMHWQAFLHLFHGLNEEHKITKMIQYRIMDTGQIENKEQRKFYQKMKRMYRLPSLKPELSDGQIGEVFSSAF